MTSSTACIEHTKNWLSSVVIGHGLCPFARREFDSGRIHYAVIEAADITSQLECVLEECGALDDDAARETSLLIFPSELSDFADYLDMLHHAQALVKQAGYDGIYQLASFHPLYRFEGAGDDDPSNYTNRSPYPMVHILRESSVEAALMNYPNPVGIPQRNIELTRGLGLAAMQALLAASFKSAD